MSFFSSFLRSPLKLVLKSSSDQLNSALSGKKALENRFVEAGDAFVRRSAIPSVRKRFIVPNIRWERFHLRLQKKGRTVTFMSAEGLAKTGNS